MPPKLRISVGFRLVVKLDGDEAPFFFLRRTSLDGVAGGNSMRVVLRREFVGGSIAEAEAEAGAVS